MRILIAFSLLVFALTAQAQLYRWIDDSGKVNYTDTPPPANAKNVQKKASAGPGGAEAGTDATRSYALQQALKNFPVVIYTSKDCGDPCKQGIDQLKKRSVPFTEKAVRTQAEIDELAKLAGEAQVPVLVVGVVIQKGYGEQLWNDALDTAGYPRATAQ
jgi:glutaredoxin